MPIDYVNPVIDLSVRELCVRPYYHHKQGCPNYGNRNACPPKAPLLSEFFNLNFPVMAVWVEFNLEQHKQKMKNKYPQWSEHQAECCLYWQPKVNKKLKANVECHLSSYGFFRGSHIKLPTPCILKATYCPEAMGVNVTETMRGIGVILEWPPKIIVRKIAFIGAALIAGKGKNEK